MHPLSPPRAPGGGLLEVRPGMLESEESWRAGNPAEAGTEQKKKPAPSKECTPKKEGKAKKRRYIIPGGAGGVLHVESKARG